VDVELIIVSSGTGIDNPARGIGIVRGIDCRTNDTAWLPDVLTREFVEIPHRQAMT
jgi:hypothetical protein